MSHHPSETTTAPDPLTGRTVRQLTNHKCHNHHLYFTNPGWFDNARRLLFGSDRHNRTNLYSVHLSSGEITQHTDSDMPSAATSFLFCSLNPTRDEAYFWRGKDLIAIDLHTNQERRLYTTPQDFSVNMTNVTADGTHIATGIYKDLSANFKVDLLNGYIGFEQYWAAKPESRLMLINTETGRAHAVFTENYWMGHVNTSPTQPHLLTFCHEGPWQKVDNRIWGCDTTTGKVWPIRPRKHDTEVVGHEYWHADGIHIGYHGHADKHTKFFGRIRHDNTNAQEVAFPWETGHIHSNHFNLIVADGQNDRANPVIRLWSLNPQTNTFNPPRILCQHRCSSHVQQVHVHPRFSPDGKTVVFTSDRTGYGQVYEVEVGDLENLPLLPDAA